MDITGNDARATAIAGSKTADHWRAFSQQLTPGNASSPWEEAYAEWFRQRLELRYLEPIRRIRSGGGFQGEGFAVVSLHCALIEFLAANHFGEIYVAGGRGTPPAGVYYRSGELYRRFLTNVEPFRAHFTHEIAEAFFRNVRCGLLHEAGTKNGWKIHATPAASPVNLGKKIVYRETLDGLILHYVNDYREFLARDRSIQEAFIRKYSALADDAG